LTPTETDSLRRAAVERVAYLLRLADALDARDATICRVAANELRAVAEACRIPGGLRVSPDAPMDPEGR
jgi:acyl-CoA reductase-like NAD-dependent aldehyde dehydrogenase